MSHLFKGPRLRAGVYFLTTLAASIVVIGQARAQGAVASALGMPASQLRTLVAKKLGAQA